MAAAVVVKFTPLPVKIGFDTPVSHNNENLEEQYY